MKVKKPKKTSAAKESGGGITQPLLGNDGASGEAGLEVIIKAS